MTVVERRSRQGGFSYLILLLWLAVMGAALSALGPNWAMDSRREREQEFVFRAEQIRRGISAYAQPINVNGCANLVELPGRLEDLLEDRRCGLVRHHLRRLYTDPITRTEEWGIVERAGRVGGVFSQSPLVPLRHIEGIRSYREWLFVADTGWPANVVRRENPR